MFYICIILVRCISSQSMYVDVIFNILILTDELGCDVFCVITNLAPWFMFLFYMLVCSVWV